MPVREALEGLIDAWRRGDALRAAAYFAEDGTYRENNRPPIHGRDALVAHFTRFFRDGPPWQLKVHDILIDGQCAALRFTFSVKLDDRQWTERPAAAFVTTATNGAITEWHEITA